MSVFGLDLEAMPEGWVPLDAFVVLKCLDEDGETALLTRSTDGLRVWDSVGMLTAALDSQRDRLGRNFVSDEPDEDDDE